MKTYPINVRRNSYRGSDSKKRTKAQLENLAASSLESYINALLLKQEQPIQVYTWGEIAGGCGMSIQEVARMGYSIDGGSNGFTAWRHDLTYEQAMAARGSVEKGDAAD